MDEALALGQDKQFKRVEFANEQFRSMLNSGSLLLASSSQSLLAQTIKLKSYPSTPQQFYACQPVSILGTESEGNTATLVPISSTFFALNLGSSVPPISTMMIVSFVSNRWVFRFDG